MAVGSQYGIVDVSGSSGSGSGSGVSDSRSRTGLEADRSWMAVLLVPAASLSYTRYQQHTASRDGEERRDTSDRRTDGQTADKTATQPGRE